MDGFGVMGRHGNGPRRVIWWLRPVEPIDAMLLLFASATAAFGALALLNGASLILGGF